MQRIHWARHPRGPRALLFLSSDRDRRNVI
nr:MAG TPA: hypothetical protein [Caudoviricetes sp.]